MSSQGAGIDPSFGLIETMLWTPADGVVLMTRHEQRLRASAAWFGFVFDAAGWAAALERHVAEQASTKQGAALRLRSLLHRDGRLEVTSSSIASGQGAQKPWRLGLAQARLGSSDVWLRHKTTRRAVYEDAFAEGQRQGFDEMVFLNERNELCECARGTLFIKREGHGLLTPALDCGLLPGTLRAELLENGQAREAVLFLPDLKQGAVFFGNSVRGLVPAYFAG